MPGKTTIKSLRGTLTALAEEMGYELLTVSIEQEAGNRYLRFYLDQPCGISLSDCERFHRAIMPLVEDVEYDYLEVSSPGVERPLKTEKDFSRHLGERITLRFFRPQAGRKEITGILRQFEAGVVTIENDEGTQAFSQKEIALAKPLLGEEELHAAQDLPLDDDTEAKTPDA